ncbi:MAG: putative toxin-antitoxin system toxin component, PIN family [Actinobacteria bacterium]|jgi:putative PIN family toxin of toxin-antitoxin system|nr:putative toxin-antitoxin system toxin component, PIN family [Actinomycetota bacterium]
MEKVVIDSNVIIAAFATRGMAQALFELCLDRYEVIISEHILTETSKALKNKIKVNDEKIHEIITFLKEFCTVTEYKKLKEKISRDYSDDNILALAKSANAKYIVTGDKDLLTLKEFEGTEIISPRELWEKSRKNTFLIYEKP